MLGYGTGVMGYIAGLITSALFDLPSGAVVVWVLALMGIVVGAFGKNKLRPAH
ncbi:MAG: hypothetical protein HY081_06820 [Gammaproteobacteria bacterium]|nr:hypothetical protein [Gammaproteobacteria bacterium]